MVFKASLDSFTKITTAVFTVVLATLAIFSYNNSTKQNIFDVPVLVILIVITYCGCFLYRPLSYEISNGKIIVNRLISNVNFNFSDIKEVKKINNLSTFWCARVFAVAGIFGYFGRFWNNQYGTMICYATKKNAAFMLITNTNKKIIITPDETDAFLEYFLKLNSSKTINIASE